MWSYVWGSLCKAQGHFLFIWTWPHICCQATDYLADPAFQLWRISMTVRVFHCVFIWIIIFVFQPSLKFRRAAVHLNTVLDKQSLFEYLIHLGVSTGVCSECLHVWISNAVLQKEELVQNKMCFYCFNYSAVQSVPHLCGLLWHHTFKILMFNIGLFFLLTCQFID